MKCTKCEETDPVNFNKCSRAKNGLRSECKNCQSNYHRNWFKANSEKERERSKEWRRRNLEKSREASNRWKRENPGRNKETKRKWREENLERNRESKRKWCERNFEKVKENNRNWRQKNSDRKNFYTAKRHSKKLQRTPKWLTEGDWIEINWAYQTAAGRSEGIGSEYNVDHIIPLQGKNVSGLHVPWNMQILSVSENSKKRNKFDGTYDNEGWLK
jgi:hypothetical protein